MTDLQNFKPFDTLISVYLGSVAQLVRAGDS